MTLRDLNGALSAERQWLPIDSAFDEATIGGIVATNDAGPSRHRHGTPRDLIIGITLALTDGRLVKAGGTVVKNVAGYDLGKLVSGSHGTLAGIADITFKLVPVPQASATLVASYTDPAALAGDVAALDASQIEAAAFDIRFRGRTGAASAEAARGDEPGGAGMRRSLPRGRWCGAQSSIADGAWRSGRRGRRRSTRPGTVTRPCDSAGCRHAAPSAGAPR